MLTLTASQLHAIEARRADAVAARLARSLPAHFPFRFEAGGIGPPEDFARRAVTHASSIGLRTEESIVRYANVAVLIGIGFESTPAAQRLGLALLPGERHDRDWLERIVPRLQGMLRERASG